jgi:hypothetical protein
VERLVDVEKEFNSEVAVEKFTECLPSATPFNAGSHANNLISAAPGSQPCLGRANQLTYEIGVIDKIPQT